MFVRFVEQGTPPKNSKTRRSLAERVGQLAARLRELVVEYGQDDRAWRPDLDRLADLERKDPKAAHDRFEELRKSLAHTRFHALRHALVALPWLEGVPDGDLRGANLKEVDREIVRLDLALERARGIQDALDATRSALGALERRRCDVDLAPFARVAFDGLGRALEDAEAARRRAAAEARAEERYRKARARAGKLERAKVDVPDLGSDAVPDAAEANASLDGVEARLDAAEKVEDLLGRVRRELRDAAVRDFRPRVRDMILERAERAAEDPDRAAATASLQECLKESADLRRYAAEKSTEAAKARRKGLRGPERDSRGDAMDGYG